MWVAKSKMTGRFWKMPAWGSMSPFGTWVALAAKATQYNAEKKVADATIMECEALEYLGIK